MCSIHNLLTPCIYKMQVEFQSPIFFGCFTVLNEMSWLTYTYFAYSINFQLLNHRILNTVQFCLDKLIVAWDILWRNCFSIFTIDKRRETQNTTRLWKLVDCSSQVNFVVDLSLWTQINFFQTSNILYNEFRM